MQRTTAYFDNAAATPISGTVLAAMQPFWQDNFYNPSAEYAHARDARSALDSARRTVADVIGAKSTEIIFTAGGTEANNMAIHGVMRQYPEATIVISGLEHDSVYEPSGQYNRRICTVPESGIIDVSTLRSCVDDKTVLVSVMYVSNEIGTIQPIHRISQMIRQIADDRRNRGVDMPLFFHTDAAQAGNYLDLHIHRLGVDLMSVNGGKIYGPKQTGVLYVRNGVHMESLLQGGGQERALRSGTENIAGSVGFAAALRETQMMRRNESVRLQQLQHSFIDQLEQIIPGVVINGSRKHRVPNNVHITLPGQDNERLQILLDEAGIAVATGSACSTSKQIPSRALGAIGLTKDAMYSSLRITMGRSTDRSQVEYLIDMLCKALA